MNGLGQSYYDCGTLGTPGQASTYNATMATEARAAWPFAGTDQPCQCGNGANAMLCVARTTANSCAVWVYTKALAGYVHLGATCACPSTADPTWN
jgi:hypothetical protein